MIVISKLDMAPKWKPGIEYICLNAGPRAARRCIVRLLGIVRPARGKNGIQAALSGLLVQRTGGYRNARAVVNAEFITDCLDSVSTASYLEVCFVIEASLSKHWLTEKNPGSLMLCLLANHICA